MTKLWLQLGRSGDVMNILPLLHRDAQTGEKPKLMVAAEFAPLLDGVPYVDPVVFNGAHHELAAAIEQAKGMADQVIVTQTNGPVEAVRLAYQMAGLEGATTTSYQKESWRLAGRLKDWDDLVPLPIVFRRNHQYEEELLRVTRAPGRAKSTRPILVAADGTSSPFPYRDLLLELIRGRFGEKHRIIDLATVKARRIYDLLALYERAHCLVAIDSALLHLARAIPKLPVFALCNDTPSLWYGSHWTPNMAWYCRYHDFPQRAVEMLDAISVWHNPQSRLVRVWNAYDGGQPQPIGAREVPVHFGTLGRDSGNTIKDEKRIPYLRDCIRMGLQRASDTDLVLVTRPDTQFNNTAAVMDYDACYAYRMDGKDGNQTFVPAVDMFCASKAWWKKHLPEVPDLLFGKDFLWSQCLWALFEKHGAKNLTGVVYRVGEIKPVVPEPKQQPPRIKHNADLCAAYVASSGVFSRYPRVSEQVETVPLELHKLEPFGYNPTMIEYKGRILMAYRYHQGTLSTQLAIAEIDLLGHVLSHGKLVVNSRSAEDPKFFTVGVGNDLMMSWVDSVYPTFPPLASVHYGHWLGTELKEIGRPVYGLNDGNHVEKNWVFFEHVDFIYFIYQCHPQQIVVRWTGEKESELITDAPKWPYGPIHGGTLPVPYEGKWLRFFHSPLDNDPGEQRRRYFMGALLMDPDPPFTITHVSRKPVLYGSEIGPVKRKDCPLHFKPNVVFPGGILARNGYWLVALGVNDSACCIAKIKPEELNL